MRQMMLPLVLLLGQVEPAMAQKPEIIDLRILYIGAPTTPRGQAYAKFLQKHFRKVAVSERTGFDPQRTGAFDVAVLDWSQSDRPDKPMSPLGPKQAWDKPTVLLGSAGLLLAQAWEIHGAIG